MAVPSSGELELRGDIALEIYGTATGNNISLGTMSNLAGFSDPDAMSDFYGYSSAAAPSVTTNNISNVAETSVTLNGNVTSDGGATITQRGFYFGTNSASPTNNTKYTVSGTTGSYTNNRTGLSSSTTYYCWAFATNSAGTTYGSRVQANTIAAFVPTWSASTTSGYLYYSRDFHNGGTGRNMYNKFYYLNPNTSSYILYFNDSLLINTYTQTGYNNFNGAALPTNTSTLYQGTAISVSSDYYEAFYRGTEFEAQIVGPSGTTISNLSYQTMYTGGVFLTNPIASGNGIYQTKFWYEFYGINNAVINTGVQYIFNI